MKFDTEIPTKLKTESSAEIDETIDELDLAGMNLKLLEVEYLTQIHDLKKNDLQMFWARSLQSCTGELFYTPVEQKVEMRKALKHIGGPVINEDSHLRAIKVAKEVKLLKLEIMTAKARAIFYWE